MTGRLLSIRVCALKRESEEKGFAVLTDGSDALHAIIVRWTSASYPDSGGLR